MFITLAWGMAVTFGVYIAGQMGSQGHLNPAVTLGFASAGLFSWSEVLPYLLGQGLGAFAGANTRYFILLSSIPSYPKQRWQLSRYFCHRSCA